MVIEGRSTKSKHRSLILYNPLGVNTLVLTMNFSNAKVFEPRLAEASISNYCNFMSEVIPIKEKIFTQPFVVVGVVLEKEDKFLLVQEGQVDVGTWNIPAGWLDLNEEIIAGAKREAQEETGLDIELTGFLGVYASCKRADDKIINPVRFIFAAKPLTDKLNYPKDEILDAKWLSYEEINGMKDKLRSRTLIQQIEDFLAGKFYPMDCIKP